MMTGVSMVLDLAVAACVVIAVVAGVKRGFIKSVIGLVGLIAAVVLAAMLTGPLAQTIYVSAFEAPLTEAVEAAVANATENVASTLTEQVENVTAGLPEVLQALLLTDTSFGETAGEAVPSEQLTAVFMEILEPLCVTAVQIVVFLLLFILLLIAVKLLGGVVDKVFSSLPVIKQANGLLGGVVGAAQGLLLVFVLCFALELYMTFAGAEAFITREQLSQTFLVKHFIAWNPFF